MLNSGTMGTVKSEPAYLIFRSKFVSDSDWVLEATVKRQAIGRISGHGFEGQNLNGFGWPDISGHHLQSGYGRQDLSNNQIGWEGFNQAYIEHY